MPITNIATLAVDIVVNARRAQGVLRTFETETRATTARVNQLARGIQTVGLAASAFLLLRKVVSIVNEVVTESIKSFAELEKHIVNIEKVAKTGDLDRLTGAFFDLSAAIKGVNFSEVSEAMIVAARSGVQGAEGITELARAALILSEISLDIMPKEATEGLAALSINLDLNIEKVAQLSNAIDVLSDNTLSTSGEILKTSARLSGFADALGISAAEVTGLSAALLATKASATTVRTTLTRLFDTLVSRPFEAAEAVGLVGASMNRFALLTRTNATEAVIQFVEAFAKLDVAKQTQVLKDLEIGSSRITQVMKQFAANTEQVRDAIQISTQAIDNSANSLSKLALSNQTTSARLTELSKAWTTFKASLVNSKPILDTIVGLLDKLGAGAGKFEIDVLTPGVTIEGLWSQIKAIDKQLEELNQRRLELDRTKIAGLAFPGLAVDATVRQANVEGEMKRLRQQQQDLVNIRNELLKADEKEKEARKKATAEELKNLKEQKAAFNAEKMKDFNSALDKAKEAIKGFELDPVKSRIQSVVDTVNEVGLAFKESGMFTLEAAKTMKELREAGMKLITSIKDEAATRDAEKARREREGFGAGLSRFAGDFGEVVETLASVSELLKLFPAGDVAGRKALLSVALGDLLGPPTTKPPRIMSDRAFRDELLTGEKKEKDKLERERFKLATRMVGLLVEDAKDRKSIIEILKAIRDKELELK